MVRENRVTVIASKKEINICIAINDTAFARQLDRCGSVNPFFVCMLAYLIFSSMLLFYIFSLCTIIQSSVHLTFLYSKSFLSIVHRCRSKSIGSTVRVLVKIFLLTFPLHTDIFA